MPVTDGLKSEGMSWVRRRRPEGQGPEERERAERIERVMRMGVMCFMVVFLGEVDWEVKGSAGGDGVSGGGDLGGAVGVEGPGERDAGLLEVGARVLKVGEDHVDGGRSLEVHVVEGDFDLAAVVVGDGAGGQGGGTFGVGDGFGGGGAGAEGEGEKEGGEEGTGSHGGLLKGEMEPSEGF